MLDHDDTVSGQPAPKQRGVAIERGTIIGRYVVLGQLGAGGMGVVYAAHDPELPRYLRPLKIPRALPPGLAGTEAT